MTASFYVGPGDLRGPQTGPAGTLPTEPSSQSLVSSFSFIFTEHLWASQHSRAETEYHLTAVVHTFNSVIGRQVYRVSAREAGATQRNLS